MRDNNRARNRQPRAENLPAMTLTKTAQFVAFAVVAVSSIALGASAERRN
jgi:hypothetical protein